MRNTILLVCLLLNINLVAQITPYTEVNAGLMVPGSSDYLSSADNRGYSVGIDLGINIDETKSFGFSFNYIKDGFDNEVQMKNVLNKSDNTETIQGSTSSIFSVGIITRATNTTLIDFIHPYAKFFFGYSYVKVAGFNNGNIIVPNMNEVDENHFTVMFAFGLLIPVSKYFSGFGIEGNYNIFMKQKEYKQIFSVKFLYRYNINL